MLFHYYFIFLFAACGLKWPNEMEKIYQIKNETISAKKIYHFLLSFQVSVRENERTKLSLLLYF